MFCMSLESKYFKNRARVARARHPFSPNKAMTIVFLLPLDFSTVLAFSS